MISRYVHCPFTDGRRKDIYLGNATTRLATETEHSVKLYLFHKLLSIINASFYNFTGQAQLFHSITY